MKESVTHILGEYATRLAEGNLIVKLSASLMAYVASCYQWLTTYDMLRVAIWVILLDWITGLAKTFTSPTIKNSSNAWLRGGCKMLVYFFLLGQAHALAVVPLLGWLPAFVTSFIIVTDAISNVENLQVLAANFQLEIPALDRMAKILKLAQAKMDDLVAEKLTPTEEQHEQN